MMMATTEVANSDSFLQQNMLKPNERERTQKTEENQNKTLACSMFCFAFVIIRCPVRGGAYYTAE